MILETVSKVLQFSLLVILGLNSTLASTEPLNLYVKSDGGCQVYNPPASFGDSVKWSGQCLNGYAQGRGVAKWYDGTQLASIYRGIFTEGKINGAARVDWSAGGICEFESYEGEMVNSRALGKGILVFKNGDRHEIIFAPNGQPTTGVYIGGRRGDYQGDRYEGEFLNNQKHGTGIYTWGEDGPWAGDVYEGEWKNNMQHGHGVYTEGNGKRYEGRWEKGERSGYGQMTYADGSILKRSWNNNYDNNYGNMTWPNGAYYEGEVADNGPNGHGKMTYPNGIVYEGDYEYGQRQGRGKMTFTDGGWLEVDMRNDAPNGEGIGVRANGIRYAGSFQDGKAWGFGHLTAPRAAYDDDKRAVNGVWQGDIFIEKGWFYDNKFKFPCDSTEDCKQVAAKDIAKQVYMGNSDSYVE